MKATQETKKLYDESAGDWKRVEPILVSDYSARPFVIDLCEPIVNKNILDLGCGEGYVGRELIKRGAQYVHGIDISSQMIEQALIQKNDYQITNASYETGDIRDFVVTDSEQYDLVLAMFLFNYLNVSETISTMQKAYQLLKLGGYFLFAVPHPSLPFLKKDKFPFYFKPKAGYFSGRDQLFPGEIWRRDRKAVGVQCVHKTMEDYFTSLRLATFTKMPEVYELKINQEHLELDPEFFTPLIDLPLHVAFKIQK
ncbi:MAG: class I SAM-dependent DNA methyltransferase [Dolichospermum sp.]